MKITRHLLVLACALLSVACSKRKEGKLPEGPPEAVKLSRAQIQTLVTGAGLVLDSEKPDLLPYQTFLLFRKTR